MSNYKVGDKVLVEGMIGTQHANEISFLSKHGFPATFHKHDIHSLAPEFKVGEEVEVTDTPDDARTWVKRKYICFDEDKHVYWSDYHSRYYWANYCRKPQQQKEETKQDQFVTMPDGKKYKLVEVED